MRNALKTTKKSCLKTDLKMRKNNKKADNRKNFLKKNQESGFQEAQLQQEGRDANKFVKSSAKILLNRLRDACQPPSELISKQDLIDRVSGDMWSQASSSISSKDFERDARWVTTICERSAGLSDGWIAVVVGWAHADPATGNQRLPGLLSSKGFSIKPICLKP
jgi:hypothetical protein